MSKVSVCERKKERERERKVHLSSQEKHLGVCIVKGLDDSGGGIEVVIVDRLAEVS